jgi:hypothetical protein
MADGFFPTLVSKDANVNSVTDPIFVQISDGTNSVTTDGAGNLNVKVNSPLPAGTNVIGHVIVDSGTITANQGTSPWVVSLTSTTITGTVAVTQSTSPWVVSLTSTTVTNTVAENLTQVGGSAISLGQKTSANSLPVVIASDQSAIPVSTAIAATTGWFVDYKTAASVASAASDTHTYTVVSTALITEISVASSGATKWQLQYGPTASPVIHWTGFITKQGGELHITFNPPISVPNTSTGVVQLVGTNRESTAQDIYSSIIGVD